MTLEAALGVLIFHEISAFHFKILYEINSTEIIYYYMLIFLDHEIVGLSHAHLPL
jgi:hypothetical protein